ncbi:MAG: hypothetical protein RLZZ293_1416 [Pseudomonadota bacterium]|jgi:cell division protein FtsZ
MSQFFEIKNDTIDDEESIINHVGEVIKVIGVGGGGCNAVDNMVKKGLKQIEFICANTDTKALSRNLGQRRLQLGHSLTRGLGAGSNPEVGKKAALEDREKIAKILEGADMLFIATGMGGGTGTGAAPVIAEIAKSLNILTVGVVTRPFQNEGKRQQIAELGIEEMRKYVDSLIVIPNEKLLSELDEDVSMRDAYAAADDVLYGAVSGITEVIRTPGLMSVDFADVRTVMTGRGLAMMGSGMSRGTDRAYEATEKAIYSPLLDDVSLDGASGVLVNISAAPGALKMQEYNKIIEEIQRHIDPEADFKSGIAEIEDMDDEELRVTIIATGIHDIRAKQAKLLLKNDVSSETTGINETDSNLSSADPFANLNRNTFSTPAFFRKK